VKKSIRNETCQIVVIPTGDLAADAQGNFLAGRFSSDQVEGHVLDCGEVRGGVIGSDTAFIVAEHRIHEPVKAVLDHPMTSDSRRNLARKPDQ
jgi:hypothetical protein